jgi:hypothetical protein
MSCQECKSARVLHVSAKCSDQFHAAFDDGVSIIPNSTDGGWGYVPIYLGIGGDKYLHFSYCLDCGRIQGTFPKELDGVKEKEQLFWELVEKITRADVERVLDVARETKYFENELGLDFNPDTHYPQCYVMAHDKIVEDLKTQVFDDYYADFHEATVAAAVFHTACLFGADPATWKD